MAANTRKAGRRMHGAKKERELKSTNHVRHVTLVFLLVFVIFTIKKTAYTPPLIVLIL